jgi:GTP-binding protein
MPATGNQPIRFGEVQFVKSVYALNQLPEDNLPEVAFAGRSNVGKSSLINRLLNRKGLVKVSAKPGKTQSLNFFVVDERLFLVDLPGYGFARVSKEVKATWQPLITGYIASRVPLRCVVVIIDIRHPLKDQDRDLVAWLRERQIPWLAVYTKADKLSRNEQARQAAALDAALTITPAERVLFSAKTGEGRDKLILGLDTFLG